MIVCRLFHDGQSDQCKVTPHGSLDLHFSNNEPCWASFHVFISHLYHEETINEKDTCTPMFITALFIISRIGKQRKYPSRDELIKKVWYVYIMEY